jgi:hypothetical protein
VVHCVLWRGGYTDIESILGIMHEIVEAAAKDIKNRVFSRRRIQLRKDSSNDTTQHIYKLADIQPQVEEVAISLLEVPKHFLKRIKIPFTVRALFATTKPSCPRCELLKNSRNGRAASDVLVTS